MTPERWQQVRRVFESAVDREVSERSAFLEASCGADTALRREVETLLRAHVHPGALDATGVHLEGLAEAAGAAPETIGPYRLRERIGRGGMADVYLASREDGQFRRDVAVKLLSTGSWHAPSLRRFQSEWRILAELDHPYVAKLLDGGTTGAGVPYLMMELVRGVPIDRYCGDRGLGTTERLRLFVKVCAAVQFAHRHLVVHRDLKPANILITDAGDPKLLDFGIAKLLEPEAFPYTVEPTATGVSPMTPEYASPEQVRGDRITTSSDVYSLGVLLYELLTGQRPYRFPRRQAEEVLRVVCTEEPMPPSAAVRQGETEPAESGSVGAVRLSGDLDNIVMMALRKEPERRYASVGELARDVERHLDGLPVLARKATLVYRLTKFVRRHAVATVAAATLLLSSTGFSFGLWQQQAEILAQRDRATWVSDFLVELFATPDPSRSRGEQTTAREVLERGTRRIDAELATEPELRRQLLATMARSHQNLGLYPEAESLLVSAASLAEELHGESSAEHSRLLVRLAEVTTYAGRYDEAAGHARRALATRELGAAERAEGELRLARALDLGGELEVAEEHYRDALELAESAGAELTRAAALSRFGNLRAKRGDDEAAREMLAEALVAYRRLHGELHPQVALTLNDLALVEQLRDHDRAEELLREAESIQRTLFEGAHPHLATTLSNHAGLLHERGRAGPAETRFLEALEMQRSVYGAAHPKVAATLNNLAGLHLDQGRHDEAESAYRASLAMRIELLGEAHAETAASLNNLGQLLSSLGRNDEARDLMERALQATRRVLGEPHEQVAVILNNLADLAHTEGDLERAGELYRNAIEMNRAALGSEHQYVAFGLFNLAGLERERRQPDRAAEHYDEAIRIARLRLGTEHPTLAMMLLSAADLDTELGVHVREEARAREALSILAATFPDGSEWTVAARRALGSSLMSQGRPDDAEPVLRTLLAELEALYGSDSAEVSRERRRQGELAQTSPVGADGSDGEGAR